MPQIEANGEAKAVSLHFDDYCFPDRLELASSLISRYSADGKKRFQILIKGRDFIGKLWHYRIVATSYTDRGNGLNNRGHFEIEGFITGGYHGRWHLGHRLVVNYNSANYDNPGLGYGDFWHFNNELAIYVPIDAHNQVDCPGHPYLEPLGTRPGDHELCTYCQGKGKIDLSLALTHSRYSNSRQERLPLV